MMKSWKDDPRADSNPLFNDNRLKIGVFGLNSGHQIMTLAPERYTADWPRTNDVAAIVDDCGIEALVSLMGWIDHVEHEPFTWAAALGARYANPAVISTMHMQLMHPTFVAKAAATIDAVTQGRFAINVVAGFNPATFAPFGAKVEDHETRYAHADEFMELLFKIWRSEDKFSFSGRFYDVKDVRSTPKPIQQFPPIMNAGLSGRGREFACKHADLVFTLLDEDADTARTQIAEYKRIARENYGRDVQVWTHGYPVVRDTRKEAEDFVRYYTVDQMNKPAIEGWVKALGAAAPAGTDPVVIEKLHSHWAAGNGSRMVGTAEDVADEMARLSSLGLDGILLNTIEPERAVGAVAREVLPRLEAAGVRRPFKPARAASAAAA